MEQDPEVKKKIDILIGLIIALVIVVLFCGVTHVCAWDLGIADSTLTGNHSVMIIAANGTLLQEGYTTETFDMGNMNETFILHILPDNTNILEDPNTLVDQIVYQVQNNMVAIVILLIMGLVIFGRR